MAISKQAKAHAISRKTKEKVWQRQHGKSLFPPFYKITVDMCCCHYISRSQGGLGDEWNIFGCYQSPWLDEHKIYDRALKSDTLNPNEMREVVSKHLADNYVGWNEKKCKYDKYIQYKLGENNEITERRY